MKISAIHFGLALIGLSLVTTADAQMSARRPGLWEIRAKTLLDGKPRPESAPMSSLPADVKVELERRMASRGMKLISEGPEGRTLHVCLSQTLAMKEPELMGDAMRKRGCESVQSPREKGSKKVGYLFTCSGKVAGSGKGEMLLTSAEKYSGWTEVIYEGAATPAGVKKPLVIRNEIAAKWLKKDCGGLVAPVEK